MSSRTRTCERCGSTIVEQTHTRERRYNFIRHIDGERVEDKSVLLCSMCLDDLWEFVFEMELDRSDKADPIPLEKMQRGVNRHIEDLRDVVEDLESHKP